MKRKTLIEERYHEIKRRQIRLMKAVQERASKMKTHLTPFLPNDLMFKIFLLLPIKTILRFNCVCKTWNKMINCAEFVEAYNSNGQTSAIWFSRVAIGDRANTFNVESQINQLECFSIFPFSRAEFERSKVMNLLEIEDGRSKVSDLNISSLGSIVATCSGLILIRSIFAGVTRVRPQSGIRGSELGSHERPGRLIIMNPMTRKVIGFSLGTLPSEIIGDESFGLVFSHSKGVYKVVHLFKDALGHIGCEIWCTKTRYWKAIDGPPENLSRDFWCRRPISASGVLHWLPGTYRVPADYIVSMGAEDEKFFVTDLPKSVGGCDKLVEMGGFLTFVSCLPDMNNIEVWALKGLERTEWIKQHTVHIDAIVGHVEPKVYSRPLLAVNAKEMIFRRLKRFYSYDFELEQAREIEMNEFIPLQEHEREHERLIPHSNNLATWEPLEPMI